MALLTRYDPLRNLWKWPTGFFDDEWFDVLPATRDNLEIYETEDKIVVKAAMPGVDPNKIDVTYEKGILTLRGDVTEDEKGKKYYRKSARQYAYRLAVPGDIDEKTQPEAFYDKGFLTVEFNKAEKAKPKKITVKSK